IRQRDRAEDFAPKLRRVRDGCGPADGVERPHALAEFTAAHRGASLFEQCCIKLLLRRALGRFGPLAEDRFLGPAFYLKPGTLGRLTRSLLRMTLLVLEKPDRPRRQHEKQARSHGKAFQSRERPL